jgi:hypothetical protein
MKLTKIASIVLLSVFSLVMISSCKKDDKSDTKKDGKKSSSGKFTTSKDLCKVKIAKRIACFEKSGKIKKSKSEIAKIEGRYVEKCIKKIDAMSKISPKFGALILKSEGRCTEIASCVLFEQCLTKFNKTVRKVLNDMSKKK